MNEGLYHVLPITNSKEMKKKKWNIFYAYNLRTIRDIFVYCIIKKKVSKDELYKAMDKGIIAPPKDKWFQPDRKRPERLRLEYVHAAEYFGLLKRENDFILPDFSEFRKEKEMIWEKNQHRLFKPSKIKTPSFTEEEKSALLRIILNYERARDFLFWFMDFRKFTCIYSFDEETYRRFAEPIYILAKIDKGKKGSKILKREFENYFWKIPERYIRLASYLFPNWFKDLDLIDEVTVFPEFSEDKRLWHMYYPVKIKENEFLKMDFALILRQIFEEKREKRLWIPYLFYFIAKRYGCPVSTIKVAMNNLYRKSPEEFYLERAPMHLIKHAYKSSYIEIDGFLRSYIYYEEGANK